MTELTAFSWSKYHEHFQRLDDVVEAMPLPRQDEEHGAWANINGFLVRCKSSNPSKDEVDFILSVRLLKVNRATLESVDTRAQVLRTNKFLVWRLAFGWDSWVHLHGANLSAWTLFRQVTHCRYDNSGN